MQQLTVISLIIFISFSVALAVDVYKHRKELKKFKVIKLMAVIVVISFIVFILSFYGFIASFQNLG